MVLPTAYIGAAQALFAAVIVLMKRPLRITDKILSVWLFAIAYMFISHLVIGSMPEFDGGEWVFSLTVSITFPPFLYLYSKYVTGEYERFAKKDYWHGAPLAIASLLIIMYRSPDHVDFVSGVNYFNQLTWLRSFLGIVFVISIWIYGTLALINVNRYKKQLVNIFSYESDKINLSWFRFVVISFVVTYNLAIIFGTLNELEIIRFKTLIVRDVGILVFLYAVSFWGYRQNQLNSGIDAVQLNQEISEKKVSETGRYQKSGLKEDDAEQHLQKLITHMNETEVWLNSELSVGELAHQTHIQKHFITQILNEKLNKNFYTFVNEYRTEYAMRMLKSPEYKNWTMLAISLECGFNSKTAFNKFFKKYTGMTPTEYKNAD